MPSLGKLAEQGYGETYLPGVTVCGPGRRETVSSACSSPCEDSGSKSHAGIARGNPAIANAGIPENRRSTFSSIRDTLLS